jgi:hypothetical protein
MMGWKNYHLYEFKIDRITIADKSIVEEDLSTITEAMLHTLNHYQSLFQEKMPVHQKIVWE